MSVLYPNVPLIAGVPAVLRRVQAEADAREQLALADMYDRVDRNRAADWGIFNVKGERVLFPDSLVSVEYTGEQRISDYPVEGGKFETYDKVQMPNGARVSMTKGGTISDRQAFLVGVDLLLQTTDVFDVVTPEVTYLNMNVIHVALVRSATNGATMVTVELVLQEVRQAAKAAYSRSEDAPAENTPIATGAAGTSKSATAIRKENQGAVQPKPAKVTDTTKQGGKITIKQEAVLKYAKPVVLGVKSGASLTSVAGGKPVYQYPVGKR